MKYYWLSMYKEIMMSICTLILIAKLRIILELCLLQSVQDFNQIKIAKNHNKVLTDLISQSLTNLMCDNTKLK